MTTFDDDEHRMLFLTGSTLQSAEKIPPSELILKALKQRGLMWRLEIGVTQPVDTTKVWLDKATVPDTVKVYNSGTGQWDVASSANEALARLLGAGETGADVISSDTPEEGRLALNIIHPEIDPFAYGATGGNAVNDMAGIAAALVDARARERPVVFSGTLAIRPPGSSSFNLFGDSSYPVRVAVPLQSGDKLYSKKCEFIMKPPASTWTPGANDRFFVFGTTSSSTSRGVYDDIDIEGLDFDFNEVDWGMSYSYAFGFVGADNVRRRRCRIYSSGSRYGRGLLAFNCGYRFDENIRHDHIVQGIYTRYDHNVTAKDLRFSDLTEAIDIDNYNIGGRWSGLTFEDLVSEAQCIDASACVDAVFENIYARDCGAVFFLYNKDTASELYADHCTSHLAGGTAVASPIACRDVVVRNVFTKDCGSAGEETFRISNSRETTTVADVAENIVLENWTLDGGYGGVVYECKDLTIRNMKMRDVVGYVSSSTAQSYALYMQQSISGGIASAAAVASRMSGTIDGLTIEGCTAGGLAISGPANMTLRDIKISDYNTGDYASGTQGNPNYGISVSRIGLKPNSLIRFEGDISVGGGPAGATDLYLATQSGASAGLSRIVTKDARFSLTSIATEATALPVVNVLAGLARYDDSIVITTPGTDTVTNTNVYIPITPVLDAGEYFKVQSVFVSTLEAITGHATNYTFLLLERWSGGTGNALNNATLQVDVGAVSADTVREMTSFRDETDVDTTITPGDCLVARFNRQGSGSVLKPLVIEVRGIRYRREVGT